MSKKLLKARYSSVSTGPPYTEKPLSVVEPLPVQCKQPQAEDINKVSGTTTRYGGPSLDEGSQWEYKPWVVNSSSSSSGCSIPHPSSSACELRQYNFRLRLNGLPPSSVTTANESPPPISPQISPPSFPSSLNGGVQQEQGSIIACDSSDWSSNSSYGGGEEARPNVLASSRTCAIIPSESRPQHEEGPLHVVFQRSSSSSRSHNNGSEPQCNSNPQISTPRTTSTSHKPGVEPTSSQKSQRKRKKEDNLLPKNCKFSRFEIVDAPIDTFNKLLEKLPNEERMVFKDSRRKGKNRGAARRARDRRIRQHDQLLKQKDLVIKELTSKKEELRHLEDECHIWAKLVDTINYHVRALESKLRQERRL